MARRRHKKGMSLEKTQDPGKDLFAYLFLMIMVFSFMLMMGMEERYNKMPDQEAPEQQEQGYSTLTTVSADNLGRLTKRDSRIFLAFGNTLYDPLKDIAGLEQDGRISVNESGKKILYIVEDKKNKVLLAEYLAAFQALNRQGIGIAFTENGS